MRKTSFFYGKKRKNLIKRINGKLFWALAWLVLMDRALSVNLIQKKEKLQEVQEAADKEAADKETANKEAAGKEERKAEGNIDAGNSVRTIRVLLMDSDFQSYYHRQVRFAAGGKEYCFSEETDIMEDMLFEGGEDGITLYSVRRQEGFPVYKGALKIQKEPEGFLLINILPLETYLEGVVPSEMPSSYQEEALKAQAICARTYACRQMEEGRLEEYGADVDDSVNYQVYNNIDQTDSTTDAVHQTAGQVLCQNGELIEAYYFSTSAGVTSTDEVWGAEEAAAYLQSVVCPFDADAPWGSWSVELPWDILQERAQGLDACSGTLESLEIVRKSLSGAVTGVNINTENGNAFLENEYKIRQFFSPKGQEITEKNGERVQGGELLPSAYFSMNVIPKRSVLIEGKGYGHGVGMSQNAADQMAKEGYTCEEILNYFFKDIEIVRLDGVL